MHDLRADLEAYTKEDMQNNNLIFKEQQKMAIKLSGALTATPEDFNARCLANNKNLQIKFPKPDALQKFENDHDPVFPRPDSIFDKKFFFMKETPREREVRRRQKCERIRATQEPKEETKQTDLSQPKKGGIVQL